MGLDLQGNVTFGNRSLFLSIGKEGHEVLGMDWFNYFVPKECVTAATQVFMDTLTRDDYPKEYELPILGREGAHRLVLWRNTLLKDAQGNILGITALGEDITEKRAQEIQLRELQRAAEVQREEIMSFVSHEVRSPLMSLRAGIELIKAEMKPDQTDALDALHRMESQIQKLDRISKDLLLSSALDGDELRFEMRRVNLIDVVRRAVERLALDIQSHRLRIELLAPEDAVWGVWDEARLDQVFSNLLSNAIKYSKDAGGTIRVTCQKTNLMAVVTVSDEGVGIPEQQIPSIFEKFRRGQNAETAQIPGFGLGLKIAKDIFERHRGTISVQSEEGVGTTFSVKLPLSAD